ncbi:cell division protein ZapA [Candidatus Palibaumannia cicadellinicola]|uniref:Cell division protein ZapA n=1 Tax=Candidatus Palibaumannia cicadellinicola TaxID=186490 RepID=A0A088MYW3_9GAMM|nr:cell division protein ZapA [Candidatus Baumannia cicadellinicola]AIN47570.1 Z-ring-associated protein ZapA [Candidatus Baumannia cicadellinicola]
MSAQPVEINILNRTLRVSCPIEQQEALNQAAGDLNKRLQELKVKTKVTNTEQLVFIAALNVCHELTQEKLKRSNYKTKIEKRMLLLQQTIEQALMKQEHMKKRSST